jgi:hypothetical protein
VISVATYNASYTEAELRDLNLPGYRREATVHDLAGRGDTDWQPVLSLSVFSENPRTAELEVLTAIRRHEAPTHPHVISTPTGRFPKAFELPLFEVKSKALAVAPPVMLGEVGVPSSISAASYTANAEDLPDRGAPLPFVAHELLARKLGMAHGLQRTSASTLIGTLSLSETIIGFSYVGDAPDNNGTERPLWEPLVMYAAVMRLMDRALIPAQTPAYRDISWVPCDQFLAAHLRKDPRRLIPGIAAEDEATVCVRGLCLISTRSVILTPGLRDHLG